MSTNDLKQQICDALAAWIRQRPGLEWRNYYSNWDDKAGIAAYRSEQRQIACDKRDAETLLQAVRWRESITADMLQEAFKHSFSGRLELVLLWPELPAYSSDDYTCHCGCYVHPKHRNPKAVHIADCPYANPAGVKLDYCTGQYWPTEYRKAAAAVLAGALRYAARDNMPLDVDGTPTKLANAGEWLRNHFRREFGSKIQRRWFN